MSETQGKRDNNSKITWRDEYQLCTVGSKFLRIGKKAGR